MSYKIECPACHAYTSGVGNAERGELSECPHCGLSSDVIREVIATRRRVADDELKAKVEDLLIRLDRAETARGTVVKILNQVRQALSTMNQDTDLSEPW